MHDSLIFGHLAAGLLVSLVEIDLYSGGRQSGYVPVKYYGLDVVTTVFWTN